MSFEEVVDMSDGQNEVPDWLKPKLSSDKLRQNNYIREWLLRPPTHSQAAWLPFLAGTGIFFVLMYEHIAYSLPFDFVNEGGIFASTCFLSFYGAELLPQELRNLAVIARIVGV
jgi:hypothetical protein